MATTILTSSPTADITTPDDLPYAIVTATQTVEWQFSGDGSIHADEALQGVTPSVNYDDANGWTISGLSNGYEQSGPASGGADATSVEFYVMASLDVDTQCTITATRTNSCVLQDHAGNIVTMDSSATLQLPPPVTGKMRDLSVRLTLVADANDNVPLPAFDNSVDWETEGGVNFDFSAEGTYILRMTEMLRAQDAEWGIVSSALPSGYSTDSLPNWSDTDGWNMWIDDGGEGEQVFADGDETATSLLFEFVISNTTYTVTATRKPVFFAQCAKVAKMGTAT